MLTVAVRLLMVLFLIRLGLRLFAAGRRARPSGSTRDLVRDRVCNTFLPRERALIAVVGGKTEHFCSAGCRDRARRALDSQAAAVQSLAGNGEGRPA